MASASRANTIAVDFVSHVGSTFTYAANLSTNGAILNGDGFTIFDFALPGTITPPAGWTASTTLVGSPVPTVAALGVLLSPGGDDPTVANIHFVRSGGPIPSGPLNLGNFTVTTTALFTGSDIVISKDSGSDTPTAFGPVPVAALVPLPATANMGLVLLGGLGGLGALRRLKNSKTVEA